MDNLLQRFLRYARVDTQSDDSSNLCPSTQSQWVLLRMLADELAALGAADVEVTEFGYVLATIPATDGCPEIPTLGLLAHVDTATDFPGNGVNPVVHEDYDGGRICLPDNPALVLDPAVYPDLRKHVGHTIVTSGGRTLLGADNKAGVAIIMTLAELLLRDLSIAHGRVRICFTPDEEIGRGVDRLDLSKFGVDYAYTVDGGELGELAFETFSADRALVTIAGVACHPGRAKDVLVNALALASRLILRLSEPGITPETTAGREGFIHVTEIRGNASEASIRLILRDFELDGLAAKRTLLEQVCKEIERAEPRARVCCEIRSQYRNMRYWLEKNMRPVELAAQAMKTVGIEPLYRPTRGGTDGSRLTEMGLLTPNIFAGCHNEHGPLEWVACQDMEHCVRMLVELVRRWALRETQGSRSPCQH